MNPAEEIAKVVRDNSHLLHFFDHEKDGDLLPDECVGCPLWVYTNIRARSEVYEAICFLHGDSEAPCNPDPDEVAHHLDLPPSFTQGISDGWDHGCLYGYTEAWDDQLYEFAGYLIGFTLRPFVDKLLPAG